MKVSRLAAIVLCLPQCAASDADAAGGTPAAATRSAEIQAVTNEHRQIFEALFPLGKFDSGAFPYILQAPVHDEGDFLGISNAGPFFFSVYQVFPIDLQKHPALSPLVKEGAALHGLRMTGVFARLGTPAANTEVYGVSITQGSAGGFLLGGLLSSVQAGAMPAASEICEPQSPSAACAAFHLTAQAIERRYREHVEEAFRVCAIDLANVAATAWQSWLADGAPSREAILGATAKLRGQLFGAQWAKGVSLTKAIAALRAEEAIAQRESLDKSEADRKN